MPGEDTGPPTVSELTVCGRLGLSFHLGGPGPTPVGMPNVSGWDGSWRRGCALSRALAGPGVMYTDEFRYALAGPGGEPGDGGCWNGSGDGIEKEDGNGGGGAGGANDLGAPGTWGNGRSRSPGRWAGRWEEYVLESPVARGASPVSPS